MEYWKQELYHHGILGQKWGTRKGPPYPLGSGGKTNHTAEERRMGWRKSLNGKTNEKLYDRNEAKQARIRYWKDKGYSNKRAQIRANSNSNIKPVRRTLRANTIHNKKHVDKKIKAGQVVSTLSYDPLRTQNTDMFYATYTNLDKQQYRALFNKKIKSPIYDEKGNSIGTGSAYKFDIQNKAVRDLDIASEDSAAKVFIDLYRNNKKFADYVNDPNRMRNAFVDEKLKFKGYREADKIVSKIHNGYQPSDKDLKTIYRMFNYVIPYDQDNNDTARQRAVFFNELSKKGYEGLLDTNDAIYGGFKAEAPVIIFDMKSVALSGIAQTTTSDKIIADLALVGRKALGL